MAERQRSLPWPQFRPPSGLAYLGYIHNLDLNHKTVSGFKSGSVSLLRHVLKLLPRLQAAGSQLTLPRALPAQPTHIHTSEIHSPHSTSFYISLVLVSLFHSLITQVGYVRTHLSQPTFWCFKFPRQAGASSNISYQGLSSQTVPLELLLNLSSHPQLRRRQQRIQHRASGGP